jgi:hypothetical protein
MSVSIYYSAKRSTPLTPAEAAAIADVTLRFNETSPTPGGEGLTMLTWTKNDLCVLLENSIQLPNGEKAFEAVPHWVRALTEIRNLIPGADWHVNLDDFEFPWIEGLGYQLT